MSDCGKMFDFRRGDGHTISSHWQTCARREGHSGEHASSWAMSDGQRAEDEAAAREDGRRLREFITQAAIDHKRREAAHKLIEAGLRDHPDEPFTVTVEAAK